MTVRIRPDLDQLPAYVAGRTVAGSLKLASNEVSAGPLPGVTEAISRAAADAHRYPDIGAARLTEELATRLDVDPGRIAVGCGSVALCEQLVQITCTAEDTVVYPWRSFEAYPILSKIVGATEVQVPLTAGHAVDLDAMAAAITPRTRLVFVCSPNNPTGPALRRAELERFLDAVPSDVLVVFDEAYREFVTDPDVPDGVELTARYDNVLALRTFSKAYGLAGLRVGYAIGPAHVAEALRKVCIPFSINAVGQAAAIASLAAQDEMRARCAAISAERVRVRDELLALGHDVPETQANFVWLPLRERTGEFNEHCLAERVVVRAFAGSGVRITIGDTAENDLLLGAAKSFPLHG
ncbi:histidinol-phosphate transaminase [Saccharopolyspora sp. NPDC047091]|uniref:histidinol-phosphate transaminase n=1 Tax=Saccharopolyspora sp. NPDC047091 TaxID=3155924 RepID=UPI0033CDB2D1